MKKIYPIAYSKDYDWTPVFSPDGSKIIFQGWQKDKISTGNAIYTMNIDGSNEHQIVTDKYNNASPVFSPDGKKVLFESWRKDTNQDSKINSQDRRNIYVVNIDGKNEKEIGSPDFQNYAPIFSPDSKKVLFESWRKDSNQDGKIDSSDNRGIYIVNLETEKEQQVTNEDFPNYSALFSPDSEKIAFLSIHTDSNKDEKLTTNDNKGIYIFYLKNSKVAELIDNRTDNSISAFSPDSKNIAFFSRQKDTNKDGEINSSDNRGIYLIDINSKKLQKIVNDDYDNEFLSFSPAGEKIAYTSYRSDTNGDGKTDTLDNRGIYVVTTKNEAQKDEINVVGNKYDNEFLAFYPDGKKVIFESWRKDTNGDGTIDVLDISTIFIVDILGAPSVKMETAIQSNGSCTRVIEIVIDPLFKDTTLDQQSFLAEKNWKTEFIKAGEHHFKAMGKFENVNEISKQDYPVTFIKKRGFFKTTCEFKEVFTNNGLRKASSDNPFINLSKEMSKVMTRPLIILYKVTVPGKLIETNAQQIKGNNFIWTFSVSDLLKSTKDYELFVRWEVTNWGLIIIVSLLLLSGIGGISYRFSVIAASTKQKQELQAKEYSEAHNYLGVAFKHKNMFDEAIKEFTRAIEFKPDSAIIHYNLAGTYALKEDTKNALIHLKTAIKLNPELEELAKTEMDLEYLRKSGISQ